MSTVNFDKEKYTQVMVFMDRELYNKYKRKCGELGINARILIDNFSDEFLNDLMNKIQKKDTDLLNLKTRRKKDNK